MTTPCPSLRLPGLTLALLLVTATGAWAEPASPHYVAWNGCLDRQFGSRASLGSRMLAVDAALRACRAAQAAYLSALSTSPLLDADDLGRAGAGLVARARSRLLGRHAAL